MTPPLTPFFDLLFQDTSRALCLVAPDGTIARANREWSSVAGRASEEIVGHTIAELFPGEPFAAALQTARDESVELPPELFDREGRETRWEGSLTPVPLEDGVGVIVAARQVKTEEAAGRDQSAALLAEYLRDMGPAGIVLYEPALPYRVLAHNRAYQEMWPEPLRSQGLVGIPVAEYAPRLQESGILDIFRDVSDNCRVRNLNHFPYDGVDGSTRWYNWTLSPVVREGTVVALAHMVVEITEEVQARQGAEADREAARSRAAELQAVLDAVPAAVFITRDRAARTVESNRYSADLLRVRQGDNVSKTAHEAERPTGFRAMKNGVEIPGEELPIQRAAGRGDVVNGYELDIAFEDGTVRRLVGNAVPLRNRHGAVYGAVGAFLDITEQKSAEEELRRAHENLRLALESITNGYYCIDRDSRFVAANLVSCQHFGASLEELLGRNIWEATGTPDDSDLHHFFNRAWETGLPVHFERASSIHAGYWAEIHVYPREDRLHVYFRDVSQRKESERALRESEERYRTLFEYMAEGFFLAEAIFDSAGNPSDFRFLEANPAFELLTGLSREEVLGRTVREAFAEVEEGSIETFGHVALTGTPARFSEFSVATGRQLDCVAFSPGKNRFACLFSDATERKRSEEALNQNAVRLRLAQAFGGIGVWDWEPASGTVYLEPEFEHLFGVPPGTIKTYEDWTSRIHPEDHPRCERACLEALRRHAPFETEFRILHESGEERWMVSRGSGVYEGDGSLQRVVGINMDITFRRRIEEALRESEEKLRVTLRSAQLGTFDYDTTTGAMLWDDQTKLLCGIPLGENLDLPMVMDLVHPADRGRVQEALSHALDPAGTGFFEVEHRIVRPDGTTVWNLSKGQAYFREEGERRLPVRVIGVNIDITQLKNAEAAAIQSEERFRTLADNIAQFAWMADPTGWIFWYNRRWFDYTGTTLEEMQGSGWQRLQHPEHSERVSAKFRLHIESGEEWEDTFPLRGTDGRYRWFLSRALPIRRDGEIVRWFGTNTDVTEQLEAEAALQEAHRRKDEFLAMLSHELRNPLGPIRNSIYLLRHAEQGSTESAHAQLVIERQTDHLTRLVDDLLDVTRIARGKIDLKKSRINLREVVQGVADDFRSVMQQRGVAFQATLPDTELVARGDRTRIVQVLGNLLHNAAKFTGMGGAVTIELALCDGAAEVSIRDTGRGIDEALLPKIFDIFVQGERTLARSEGGLGLGLALVKGITELHGGTVRAESAGEGKGATFVVRLPLEEIHAPKESSPAAHGATPAGKKRILVVDDNTDAADSLASIVRMLGYQVEVAYDGPSAVATALSIRPHLVLCDVGLPGMSGYEVAGILRRTGGENLVLVAITGYARAEDVETAIAAGFDRHLAKPVYIDNLVRLIAEVTSRTGHHP